MNKKVVISVVVLLALVGGGIALAMNHKNSPNNTTTKTTTTKTSDMSNMPTASSDTNTQSEAQTNSVVIDNFAFSPSDITVKKGTTVTWTNKDSATHTVTEIDSQKGPDSGDLATGKSYSFTYDTVGTFKYHCAIHSSMTGTVTVTE